MTVKKQIIGMVKRAKKDGLSREEAEYLFNVKSPKLRAELEEVWNSYTPRKGG